MIFGGCPYCDGDVINYMPEVTPVFAKRVCEHCNETYWLLCSRISSEAYTVEDFLEEYEVDEETKEIRKLISVVANEGTEESETQERNI